MLVTAKCVARAWDSTRCVEYLPGLEYEIDTESDLASLTVVPVALNAAGHAVRYYEGKDGKLQEVRVPKPAYVFEFDRTATRTDEGVAVVKDYSCKLCGKQFKSLHAVGTHTRMAHKKAEPEETEVVTE